MLTEKLEALGYEVFLPQRDGAERNRPPYAAMPAEEKRRLLSKTDRDRIFAADVFFFVLDGRASDEGACVELGLAYAAAYFGDERKVLIGLHTDTRAAFLGVKLNPVLSVPFDEIAETEEALFSFLQEG